MGKKSSGKLATTSKGERPNLARKTKNAMRRDYLENCQLERLNNQMSAWKKMKNVMLTVPNPNKNETNKRFIRVSAREFWGNPAASFLMKSSG
jgi:hypothetical protein